MPNRKDESSKHMNVGITKLEALPANTGATTTVGAAIAELSTETADGTSETGEAARLETIASMDEAAEGSTDARLETRLAATDSTDDKTADSLATLAKLALTALAEL
jgi:hypothetical protein